MGDFSLHSRHSKIPRRQNGYQDPTRGSLKVAQPGTGPSGNYVRMCSLLLVDDDLRILKFYGLVLEQAGYHVRVAETSARAVTLLKETDPEIVIMDLRVPDM